MSGSRTGPENWPERWAAKQKALESVDWPNFRANPILMQGIETNLSMLASWVAWAKRFKIPRSYLRDSLYGSPAHEVVDGVPMTATSVKMAFHAKAIADKWGCDSPRILEIGGGYGALAFALAQRFDIKNYYVIDHPSCIKMQLRFIVKTTQLPTDGWLGQEFDLAVNTCSFGEMDPDDVAGYFELIKKHLVPGGALYINNRLKRVTDFKDYPYGPGWEHKLVKHPLGNPNWVHCLSVRDEDASSPHPFELF